MKSPMPPPLPEKIKVTAETPREEFDIEKAMNTKGFMEFLAKHGEDSINMGNEAEVGEKFEIFKAKAEIAKELGNIYKNQIQQEIGIVLDVKDLSSIDSFLDKTAIEEPEKLSEMRGKLKLFKELPEQIRNLESQLIGLGKVEDLRKDLEGLTKDQENIKEAQKGKGILGFLRNANKRIEATELWAVGLFNKEYAKEAKEGFAGIRRHQEAKEASKGKILSEVEAKIATVSNTLDNVTNKNSLKELAETSFAGLRKGLLGEIGNIAELTEAIQKKAVDQLERLTGSGSFKDLEKKRERFDSLRKVAETTETGVNPLSGINEEDFSDQLDLAIETKASTDIMEAVLHAKMGENTFSGLEQSLKTYIENKKLGSKEGNDAKNSIIGLLKEASDNLGNEIEDKAKKLMLARIIIKMQKTK